MRSAGSVDPDRDGPALISGGPDEAGAERTEAGGVDVGAQAVASKAKDQPRISARTSARARGFRFGDAKVVFGTIPAERSFLEVTSRLGHQHERNSPHFRCPRQRQ